MDSKNYKNRLKQKEERVNLDLTKLEVSGTAWIRYERKRTTFTIVDGQVDNWLKLSHEIEGINAGPRGKISRSIDDSKEIEKIRLVKIR